MVFTQCRQCIAFDIQHLEGNILRLAVCISPQLSTNHTGGNEEIGILQLFQIYSLVQNIEIANLKILRYCVGQNDGQGEISDDAK